MLCPKDRKTELELQTLEGGVECLHCSSCEGSWISVDNYSSWHGTPEDELPVPDASNLEPVLEPEFEAALEDVQAALCPSCQHYLTRSRIGFGQSFFLERCKNCGGFWFDRGEWELLARLGLNINLDYLFTPEWQDMVRQREQFLTERRVLIDKLGDALAQEIFEMAEKLEGNPNGDFAVAYLMRRFDGDSQ